MRERVRLIKAVFIFFIFISTSIKALGGTAERTELPRENEKIYAVGKDTSNLPEETKDYWLKVKLKPKVVEGKVYWQERLNWQEEIENWRFGIENDLDLPSQILELKEKLKSCQFEYTIENSSLKIDFSGEVVLSRNLDFDLEEYPLINIEFDSQSPVEFSLFSGMDYSGDGKIDDYIELYDAGEFNLFDLAKDKFQDKDWYEYGLKAKKIILLFKCLEDNCVFELKPLRFYNEESVIVSSEARFPYPLKSEKNKIAFLQSVKKINPPLVKIDEEVFRLNDFEFPESFEELERGVLSKRIELSRGEHKYEKLENATFEVEWVILEPAHSSSFMAHSKEPEITFKKINPTKYLVKVEGAREPFWLVFSESFHKQWKLYSYQLIAHSSWFEEIVADYPELKVKEARHLMKFTPEDIRYLFKKPLEAEHLLVNGYANGWYIEPQKLGLGKNFILVIYFWPQSLFYLGLGISGLTLLGCIGYLIYDSIRKRKNKNVTQK
ncbi:MAG: hypothetical protein AB7E08_05930 [Candidatus Omnitrophota bacterium]